MRDSTCSCTWQSATHFVSINERKGEKLNATLVLLAKATAVPLYTSLPPSLFTDRLLVSINDYLFTSPLNFASSF